MKDLLKYLHESLILSLPRYLGTYINFIKVTFCDYLPNYSNLIFVYLRT